MAAGGVDKRRLVEEIIDVLEEDRGLRYALMGLLGFREILERITRLEERQQRLEERFAELEERFARLEERLVKLEERFAKLEEEFRKLGERQQRLEERLARLEERQQRLEERFAGLERELVETRRLVFTVAHRFGVISEEAFREAMKYVVEETFGVARVEKWVHRDEEGLVYGHPATIEVDLLVRDGEHILLEIKSRVSKADVAELHRIGLLYQRVTGRKPRLVILGGFVDPGAYPIAASLGVEVRPLVAAP